MDFAVDKSTKREPNRAVIRVYNLSTTRIETITTETQISLEAGYVGLTDLLYTGQARTVEDKFSGVDRVLEIESEDAGRSYSRATLDQNWGASTPFADILRSVVSAMEIGAGNLDLLVNQFERDEGPRTFPEGFTASGPAWRTMDNLCRSAGFRWSVQNGVLQLRRGNRPVDERVLRLSPGTGLVGSPSQDADGKVSATAYLIPGLNPGRVVVISSRTVNGGFQIKRVRYSGASFSQTWEAKMDLEPY
jgi:hypothetical protein